MNPTLRNFTTLLLAGAAAGLLPLRADEMKPSPKETFTIAQRGKDAGDGTQAWTASVIFPEGGAPETTLVSEDDAGPWPGVFEVSPDDRWILQIRKIGSGQSTAFLYEVAGNQRIARIVQPLEDFGWQALADLEEKPRAAYNAMKVEFAAWDLAANLLKFKIIGFRQGENDEDITRVVNYDLARNKYSIAK
jgi:hypothetical protein